jgi:hypothetical protein
VAGGGARIAGLLGQPPQREQDLGARRPRTLVAERLELGLEQGCDHAVVAERRVESASGGQ